MIYTPTFCAAKKRRFDARILLMNTLLTLARKELKDGLRNRWVLAIAILLAAFALTLAFLGSAPAGETKANALAITVVSLATLNIYLIPLIALLLSYDAIVGEIERGTMALLLSYPLSRWQVVAGKFLGQGAILAVAIAIGYCVAGIAVALLHKNIGFSWAVWQPFFKMTLTTLLLGAVFLAIGYVLSAIAKQRGSAAGMAIGVWLFFVLLYDFALLGVLIADKGQHIGKDLLNVLLLANPTDTYRLLNLSGNMASGLGAQGGIAQGVLALVLLAWIAAPLALGIFLFRRKTL